MYAIGSQFTALSPSTGRPALATVTAYWFDAGRNRGLVIRFEGDKPDTEHGLKYEELRKLRTIVNFGSLELGAVFWVEDPDAGWNRWRRVKPFHSSHVDCDCADDGWLNAEATDQDWTSHYCEEWVVRPTLQGKKVKV